MALLRVDVISKALDMATSFMAVLPDEGNLQKTRVVYLLHGLTDNCTGWTRYTSCDFGGAICQCLWRSAGDAGGAAQLLH